MTTAFFLVITFWAGISGSYQTMGVSVIPTPYATEEACKAAGATARAGYNGGAHVEWTCVPAEAR